MSLFCIVITSLSLIAFAIICHIFFSMLHRIDGILDYLRKEADDIISNTKSPSASSSYIDYLIDAITDEYKNKKIAKGDKIRIAKLTKIREELLEIEKQKQGRF